jgi:hypothetical protein
MTSTSFKTDPDMTAAEKSVEIQVPSIVGLNTDAGTIGLSAIPVAQICVVAETS